MTSPSSVPSAALVPPLELALVDPGASLCGLASGDVSPGRGFAAWSACPAATAAAVITCACEIVSVEIVPMLMRTTASFAAVSGVPFTMPSETRRTRGACASTPCVVRSPISPEQTVRTRRSGNSDRGRIVHTSGTERGIVISSGRW